jgi:nucleoside-diphosphate-sugar epimerase
MKPLLAGSGGYIGKNFIVKLQKSSHSFITLTRAGVKFKATEFDPKYSYKPQILGTGNFWEITSLLKSTSLTHIVNLAGSTNKQSDWNSANDLLNANIKYSLELALIGQELKIPDYIYLSTYSTSINGVNYEPQTLYAATKKASEDLLFYFASCNIFNVSILNLYDVYGPLHPHKKIISMMLEALISGKPFEMSKGDQEICPIHIDDVVDGIFATLSSPMDTSFRHFDLFGTDVIKLKELPILMEDVFQIFWHPDQLKFSVISRPREIQDFRPRFGLPDFWKPKITLARGLKTLQP